MTSVQEGAPPVASFAGEAVAAWSDLVAVLHSTVAPEVLSKAQEAVASVLTPSVESSGDGSAAAAFGQQMVADVASLTEAQRNDALSELGAAAVDFAYALWICDTGTRARAAFTQLRGEPVLADPLASLPAVAGDVKGAQTRFLREVARLSGLDSVTAEVIRLRGAVAHACRLCQSVRNVSAMKAAGGVEFFESFDGYEASDLSPRHKAALRLVDTFVWQPMAWPEGVAAAMQEHFTPVESAEAVFDLMRNSYNKIAVAFAADAAHVEEGLEFYDIDPSSGDLTWGLSLD